MTSIQLSIVKKIRSIALEIATTKEWDLLIKEQNVPTLLNNHTIKTLVLVLAKGRRDVLGTYLYWALYIA